MKNIESYSDFTDVLELDIELLSLIPAITSDSSKFYRTFKIPKRKGGYRTIECPYPSLGAIQAKILRNILSSFDTHASAYAYRKKYNALQHASLHLACSELLTLDLKNFFPSISRQMVFQVLQGSGMPSNICQTISLLCCVNGVLPQGACTSPAISNIVFMKLDSKFLSLANSLNLKYSRYADDLAFSGERIPRKTPRLVGNILKSRNFQLNDAKTNLKIAGAKKIITGVSISSGIAKVPKSYKRKLRAEIYELEKNVNHLSLLKNVDPLIYERLLGKLNYFLQIEPENPYAKIKKKLLSEYHQKFLGLAL